MDKSRRKIKNKKGFLLAEETLKIILSVIAIGFLIYFLASLYYSNKGDNEMELAQASLEHLVAEINVGVTEVQIYNPKGWMFSSWPFEDKKPDICSDLGWAECLCLCEEDSGLGLDFTFNPKDRKVAHCNKNGFCMESEGIIFGKDMAIEIEESGLNLNINYDGDEVVVNHG